ncbi:MAG TPA: diguanylate cyclase [Gemmatimonadales bacterium]|nr:diguanylate cyclase [Gemmatimonadales bacterium]
MGPRILIADADRAAVQAVSWVLREQGYDVHAVAHVNDLLSKLDSLAPELLILNDLVDGSGMEALRMVKGEARWRDLPVLVVAEQPPEDAAIWNYGMGASDFLRKPFRVRELLARVEAQLRVRRMLVEAREALGKAERELKRVRSEAETRRRLVDIVHEVTGELEPHEIYQLLARRVARALDLSHASVVLVRDEGYVATVVANFEDPAMRDGELDLWRYPEIRAALDERRVVIIEDVSTDSLYSEPREFWEPGFTASEVRSAAALPFEVHADLTGVLFLRRGHERPPLSKDDIAFAESVMRAAIAAVQRAQLLEETRADNARLEALAQTDPLTQLLNRRALVERVTGELDRAQRYGSMLGLLMVDLDRFKDVNDSYGHLFGDEVLRTVARVLAAEARSSDVAARYGGEEFVLVLPETGLQGSQILAERVREEIARLRFQAPDGTTFSMTASIGLACYPAPGITDVESLLARADEALYRAKAAGRNRVVL